MKLNKKELINFLDSLSDFLDVIYGRGLNDECPIRREITSLCYVATLIGGAYLFSEAQRREYLKQSIKKRRKNETKT